MSQFVSAELELKFSLSTFLNVFERAWVDFFHLVFIWSENKNSARSSCYSIAAQLVRTIVFSRKLWKLLFSVLWRSVKKDCAEALVTKFLRY